MVNISLSDYLLWEALRDMKQEVLYPYYLQGVKHDPIQYTKIPSGNWDFNEETKEEHEKDR